MSRIQRALLSVYDKSGLVPFARILADAKVELLSTGGTARLLRENGLVVKDLSEFTGFPEMLDGRVKTLHPMVHGGLLYLRGNPEHEATVARHGITPIDLVVVNLYPFEETIARPGVTLAEAIENIDIGGPAMLRSAAKNHESVTVLTDPADYAAVGEQIRATGTTTAALRRTLAARVYARTSAYDARIAGYLEQAFAPAFNPASPEAAWPEALTLHLAQKQPLRYGENPHQSAALYGGFAGHFQQIHGKELSYNNILDLTAATHLISEFLQADPTVAILKHTNPCGVGQATTPLEAWEKALATDRQAPFGGIIALNRALDGECAQAISNLFSEVIVTPDFTAEALAILQAKKNLRLVRWTQPRPPTDPWQIRSVGFGTWLAQRPDSSNELECERDLKVVTRRAPSPAEWAALKFGWRIVKHVKSNAIIYAAPDRTLGIGAGQMSRVDASRIAVWKASEAGLSLQGSVVCSDAFFPFPDGLIAAAEAGATAAIQPGGSVRDPQVIEAADARNLAMVLTGVRHFRH